MIEFGLYHASVYLAGGSLASDYPYLCFMARVLDGKAYGLMNEALN